MKHSQEIEIVVRAKTNLSLQEQTRLRSLTLKNGLMEDYFDEYNNCIIILAIEDDVILGWAINFMPEDEEDYETHLYVSKYRRREGIGTMIMDKVLEIFGSTNVSKWDSRAESFYNNFENIEEL